jgi:hypothetical protein
VQLNEELADAFKHLDLNIPRLIAHKRGTNTIQGSLSIDDEVEGNCTIILPKMHRHLKEGWHRLSQRQGVADGYVHRIDDNMFSAEDAALFDIRWTDQPCLKGDVPLGGGGEGPLPRP